jgi:hypothetical protein
VRLAPMREEEEGGRLGREVSWAGREAEAQWERGGGNGRLEEKKGRSWAEIPNGPANCWAGWAESEEKIFSE